MQLVATYDFTLDRDDIKRGDTVTISDDARAKSLIRQGAFMRPEDWAKRKPTADASWNAAQAEVARLDAACAALKAAKGARQ